MDADGKKHSFIQMIDGTRGKTYYERFEFEAFKSHESAFEVSVGTNSFNDQRLSISLPQINGEIRFADITPWPGHILAPGVMGWYSYVPMMQCYHGVVSVHHRLSGKLNYDGKEIDFDNGIGYIEKDWGTSFPKCWIWMQSNHFGDLNRKVSLMVSVAHIPWLGNYFVGYLVAFYLDDKLHQFSTYNGAKMKSRLEGDQVILSFSKKNQTLDITATKGKTGTLISPISGEMVGKVNESLTAMIDIAFKINGKTVFEGTGRNAGLEVAGETQILLTDE